MLVKTWALQVVAVADTIVRLDVTITKQTSRLGTLKDEHTASFVQLRENRRGHQLGCYPLHVLSDLLPSFGCQSCRYLAGRKGELILPCPNSCQKLRVWAVGSAGITCQVRPIFGDAPSVLLGRQIYADETSAHSSPKS